MTTQHYRNRLSEVFRRAPKQDKASWLNDHTDTLCREIDYRATKGEVTQRRAEQVKKALINHCIKLHP